MRVVTDGATDSMETGADVDRVKAQTVLLTWARGVKCFSPQHEAIAKFVVNGGDDVVPACGDHLSVAVRETALSNGELKVTVWVKP